MDDDTFDLSGVTGSSAHPAWRKRAVELAVERNLAGQAALVTSMDRPRGIALYTVISASEALDRRVVYNAGNDTVTCDCPAGVHDRPCSHAGAVLLLVRNLVPERVRPASGV